MLLHADVIEEYRDFASYAAGDSPCFEEWALAVAEDAEVLAWLGTLPTIKRQPNLVFAAARWHGAPAPGPYDGLRRVLREQEPAVRETVMTRATQTNEAGRLATLAPVLGLVDGPLALVEVGASAGLCLFPDRYDYDWPSAGTLRGSGGPRLTARATGRLPVPTAHPDVAWRGGVDLNPLDVTDPDATAWLENLVWPEQDERRERLRAAIEVARREPPEVRRGDLFDHLPGLLGEAARHGTPVVFHSAVVAYLEEPGRERFHDLMTDLVAAGRCRWISNEGRRVLPRVSGDRDVPAGRFVTALDGVPVAHSHGHGHTIDWL
ncbi:hypothetical protein GCM10011376_18080 [Nocardioides flavus (ex Wang et al. 2016)]|uniref:DUF2332 domain-containing protein n=1 Tax=Nocardioides flavus (ex Wang et al. 2016) TaxID=2058780 RepID=A0ABQ3HHT3_9ACTN|nr:DUF2332 domain-containing protein [Nocardioides flavus (ex Wang et al. 2016)]GHE17198.1 hypothetical protein GCM10011376_18080 [Nocardioides flavus (ex Wang et al. 2016)]